MLLLIKLTVPPVLVSWDVLTAKSHEIFFFTTKDRTHIVVNKLIAW